jgi:hypothetical protein
MIVAIAVQMGQYGIVLPDDIWFTPLEDEIGVFLSTDVAALDRFLTANKIVRLGQMVTVMEI